jgi:hypothetical protein
VFPIRLGIVPAPGDMVQGPPKAPQLDWDFVDGNDIQSRLCPTLTVYLGESEVIEVELSSTLPNVIEKEPKSTGRGGPVLGHHGSNTAIYASSGRGCDGDGSLVVG